MSIKVLIAEEQQDIRQGLHALLAREPDISVVAEAPDSPSAIHLVRELAPHVVIVDVSAPHLKGFDTIYQILDEYPRVKIIAVSTLADRRVALNMLKAGASAYLLKDCGPEELAQAIREVMAKKIYLSPAVSDIVLKDYVEVLRESEAKFRTVFESATIGIALMDMEGRLLETSPALQEMLGYHRDEFHNMVFFKFAHPDDAAQSLKLFRQLAGGKRNSYQMDNRYLHKDGRLVWGRLTVSVVQYPVGRSPFALAMVEDINERKQAEEEIRAYQERLRSLASEISLIEEQERRTLATDLHDHIGQVLALAQIKLGELRETAANTPSAGTVDEVRQLIEQTIKATRSLTFELSPPILYELGLEAAVEWFGEHLQDQYNLLVEVTKDRQPKPMGNETQVLLFKTVRELMINAAKHAQARLLRITIARKGENLLIQVADDGVGFDPTRIERQSGRSRSFGLFSVRERLRRIGGHLQVQSQIGRGTTVALQAPIWQENIF